MGAVTAVMMDVVTEKSGHTIVPNAVSVCTTPAAPSPVPIPYPVVGNVAEGISDNPLRTKVNGSKFATTGSVIKTCHGNEPGTLKEVVSLNTAGPCFPIMGAPVVLSELGMIAITTSMCISNKAPTPGGGGSASGAGGAGGAGGGGGGGGSGGGGPSGPSGPGGGGGSGGGGSNEGASARDRELAAQPNASPDDGLNDEREQARRRVADDFYQQHSGMDQDRINSHTNGIDFTQPVEATNIPPPPQVECNMWPGNNPQPGNYFAPPGTDASTLGINPNAYNRDTGGVEPRPVGTFTPPASGTPALRSTAAPVTDDWSDSSNPYQADGGGTQYYVPDNSGMTAS